MKPSFDPKCLELAEHFLADVPDELKTSETANDFAQHIQDAIEMYLDIDLGMDDT